MKLVALAALVVPLTTACSVEDVIRLGWPVGVTPQAEWMRTLWEWAAWSSLVVGAITWAAMFWAVARHRRKADAAEDDIPRQTQYNLPLELAFTIIPTIIVAVLYGCTVYVQNFVERDTPTDMKVAITAFQWNWDFAYPATQGPNGLPVHTLGTTETIPIMVLPTNRSIEFEQRSNDVIHSFWVPEFLFKRDVFPLPEQNDQDWKWQINKIDHEGAFVGRCAELCGSYHSQMNFEVRALSPQLFDQWLAKRTQINPATGAAYTAGEALGALNCGELCTPHSITTYPFNNDRTARTPSLPPAAAGS